MRTRERVSDPASEKESNGHDKSRDTARVSLVFSGTPSDACYRFTDLLNVGDGAEYDFGVEIVGEHFDKLRLDGRLVRHLRKVVRQLQCGRTTDHSPRLVSATLLWKNPAATGSRVSM